MGKLVPIILAIFGLAGGVGAGLALRPSPDEDIVINPCGDVADNTPSNEDHSEEVSDNPLVSDQSSSNFDYMKMNNQFVIPVVLDGRVKSLVVLTISLEVLPGQMDNVYSREPKLRDSFLRVMFDHANSGGFQGEFTESGKLNALRLALREVAQKNLGGIINDVLILDIVRQDSN